MNRVLLGCLALLAFGSAPVRSSQDEKKTEDAPHAAETRRRPSDVIFILIEMSDVDAESVEELQRLYDVLRKLDKNNDGKIDPGELKTVRQQLISDRVDHLFKKLDTDQDGKISKDEARGRIREHFDRLDRNGDGFIDRDELRQAIEARTAPEKREKAGDEAK